MVASTGANSIDNPIGVREHENVDYQGLRLIAGNQGPFPLIDAYYQRSFGVGVRHRGAAVAIQITASSSYTAPAIQIP